MFLDDGFLPRASVRTGIGSDDRIPLRHGLNKRGRGDAQTDAQADGQPENRVKAGFALFAFEQADGIDVQARASGQFLLGKFSLHSENPKSWRTFSARSQSG